jgi:hemerythrin
MDQQDFTRWQSSYSVGNWVLNNQHKVLLSLCKQTIECVSAEGPDFVGHFSIIRDDFLDSLDAHFRTEENLLRYCAYPLLLQHQEEHRESRIRLSKFLQSATSGAIDKGGLHDFLAQWWLHHVLDSDKKFTDAIQRVA